MIAVCIEPARELVDLPARPQIDRDGRHRIVDGKKQHSNIVEIPDNERRKRFSELALEALYESLRHAP